MALDIETLKEIWAEFIYEGKLDPRIQPPVADSWQKCRAYGVNPEGGCGTRVADAVFQSIKDANRTLIDTAMPIMHSVFEIVQRSHFMLVLTDAVGYILVSIGDEMIMSKTRDMRYVAGALWNSQSVGTNAISVALDYDTAIQMVGPEHYCRSHHGWTCSAAPIHGENGEVIGCINMSGDADKAHDHTLGLVLAAVYGIEGQMSLLRSREILRTALEVSADGIMLVGTDYHPIWGNSAALRLFGAEADALTRLDVRTLMPDIRWNSDEWNDNAKFFADDTRVLTRTGTVRCTAAITPAENFGTRTMNVTLKKQKHLIDSVNKMSGNRASYTFDDIYTRDMGMKKTIALARKYALYDGNILIEGDSGTGKELIAQAIHNAGSRAGGPFVAINCASIPRDLLETELFGYEAGAFPGSSGEGNPGRFELANRGTLFLDEISELPLEFQSKLLRAVETHCINRLGGGQDVQLDIRIITATSTRLEEAVTPGSFRRDLYFRLNVLKLEIPPLRERPGDISYCAGMFLERLNRSHPDMEKSFAPEFVAGLMKYDWPGNVRELQNGIERAFYSSVESILTEDSLRYVMPTAPRKEEPEPQLSGEAGEILAALTVAGGSVDAAAARLGVSRATLYRRLKKYGINPKVINF
ncbi:MAG TPA: sigma-54-dependent Fis family transcriptional regulator [Oscillospiraceae bacterium]|nr:sigma-54-dependent Fis family transcriptional regulator [Oscillospiraceae bacterium]